MASYMSRILGRDGRSVGSDEEVEKVKSRRQRCFLFVLVIFRRRRRRPPPVHIWLRRYMNRTFLCRLFPFTNKKKKEKKKRNKKTGHKET